MKKRIPLLILLVLLTFVCIWIGTIIHCSILTSMHGHEFSYFQNIDFCHMHPWEGTPQLRIIEYSDKRAMVYYYASTGGELAEFIQEDGKWTYKETHATWSNTGGTADDYFVWPYYKNLVP